MDLQAMDRAHRIGQKKQVTVFRFVVEHSIEQKMVERATAKLFLDALVIKQGRLNEADKSVSAQELQDMVRFGASRIFQGADAETITDEDIDIILARGSEMTKLQTEKMKQNAGNDLLNFSMTDEAKTNFQMFEGKDYTGFRASTGFDFIEPAKRERKGSGHRRTTGSQEGRRRFQVLNLCLCLPVVFVLSRAATTTSMRTTATR